MNKVLRTRVATIQAPPPNPAMPLTGLEPAERIMVMCAGDVNIQIPLEYADCLDGSVAVGDIFEIEIRKIPALGRRIGEGNAA